MKIKRVIYIYFVLVFLTFTPNTTLVCQTGASFDINSQTLIVDTKGNYIDFQTFINLNPGSDYGDLMPEFDENGKLKLIKISLKKPLVAKKEVKPLPKAVVKKTTPSPKPQNQTIVTNKHISTPKVEEKTKKKKFRFTNASELQGLQAPYYSEKDVDGKTHSTNTLYGKIVVIKFWFLKCAPCLEEIPELNKLVNKYKNNSSVKFLAPATDDFDAVRKFLTKRNFSYSILPDSYNIHGDFKVAGYPTHLVINKNGTVGKVFTGKNTHLVEVLSNAIDEALMLDADDLSMKEIPQPLYSQDMIFRAEGNQALSKEEYLNKLASGLYKVYKKTKVDGREEIFLRNMYE